jgi:hypothetical protein
MLSGSVDQWISGGRRSHGGAEARRKQREEPTTGHKGNWRVPCSCLRVETPVVAHRCFTLPRSSILCGCINFPGRLVNAVWGRYPTACTMYVKKKAWSLLGARRQNISRLRVEDLGCVTRSWPCLVTGLRVGRQVGPAVKPEASTGMPASRSSRPDLTDS